MPLLTQGVHVREFGVDQRFIRIHRTKNKPFWFGPRAGSGPECRFDAPNGEYRAFYAGFTHHGAFAETVLHTPVGQIVRPEDLFSRAWTEFQPRRTLRLAELCGPGLKKHGITAQQVSDDYEVTQALALEAYNADPELDGLYYRSIQDNDEHCIALFDRVDVSELAARQTISIEDWGEANWRPLLQHYGVKVGGYVTAPDDFETVMRTDPSYTPPPGVK